jgi:hypothetical protein
MGSQVTMLESSAQTQGFSALKFHNIGTIYGALKDILR